MSVKIVLCHKTTVLNERFLSNLKVKVK